MSVRELIPILRPQKLEPATAKALVSVVGTKTALQDGKRIIRAYGFKAFLGGHFVAVAELRQHWEYSLGDYSMQVIQTARERFINDLQDILNKLVLKDITLEEAKNRAKILAQVLIWTLYNEGKLSTYRQRNEGKIGEPQVLGAQWIPLVSPEFKFFVVWITQGDERVCPRCEENDRQKFPLYGPLITIPAHPGCRCEWNYEEAMRR